MTKKSTACLLASEYGPGNADFFKSEKIQVGLLPCASSFATNAARCEYRTPTPRESEYVTPVQMYGDDPNPDGLLQIFVRRIRGIVPEDCFGTREYFVNARYPEEDNVPSRASSAVRAIPESDGLSVELHKTLQMPMDTFQQLVIVTVWEADQLGDILVGEIPIPLYDRKAKMLHDWPLNAAGCAGGRALANMSLLFPAEDRSRTPTPPLIKPSSPASPFVDEKERPKRDATPTREQRGAPKEGGLKEDMAPPDAGKKKDEGEGESRHAVPLAGGAAAAAAAAGPKKDASGGISSSSSPSVSNPYGREGTRSQTESRPDARKEGTADNPYGRDEDEDRENNSDSDVFLPAPGRAKKTERDPLASSQPLSQPPWALVPNHPFPATPPQPFTSPLSPPMTSPFLPYPNHPMQQHYGREGGEFGGAGVDASAAPGGLDVAAGTAHPRPPSPFLQYPNHPMQHYGREGGEFPGTMPADAHTHAPDAADDAQGAAPGPGAAFPQAPVNPFAHYSVGAPMPGLDSFAQAQGGGPVPFAAAPSMGGGNPYGGYTPMPVFPGFEPDAPGGPAFESAAGQGPPPHPYFPPFPGMGYPPINPSGEALGANPYGAPHNAMGMGFPTSTTTPALGDPGAAHYDGEHDDDDDDDDGTVPLKTPPSEVAEDDGHFVPAPRPGRRNTSGQPHR